MKHNKVLKSLEELSPALLESENPHIGREQAIPAQPQLLTQNTGQIVELVLTDADVRSYRGWGIND